MDGPAIAVGWVMVKLFGRDLHGWPQTFAGGESTRGGH